MKFGVLGAGMVENTIGSKQRKLRLLFFGYVVKVQAS